uniref:histidine kinase n=1 Tax=Amphora coffeiformis TaxID=265554 RepID=A0A7S3KZN6_9STRA
MARRSPIRWKTETFDTCKDAPSLCAGVSRLVFIRLACCQSNRLTLLVCFCTRIAFFSLHAQYACRSGPGDLHKNEPEYNRYRQSIDLVERGLFTDTSTRYILSFYPNTSFHEIYSTKNPWIAAFGAASIFVVTCLLFFLYDNVVGKDLRHKQELLRAKRHFIRFISHEVRTPLNATMMGLELAQRDIAERLGFASIDAVKRRSDETQAKSPGNDEKTLSHRDTIELLKNLGEVMEHAQSAVSVLSDILNYDKVETGNLSLDLSPISFFSLVAKTVNEFRLSAECKGLGYEASFLVQNDPDSTPTEAFISLSGAPVSFRNRYVIGDRARLQQTIRNFLSNAIKFTKAPGSVHVTVKWEHDTSLQASGHTKQPMHEFTLRNGRVLQLSSSGRFVVEVKDTGAGMTPEQLSKLFTAGTQFNVNELQAGQGSGLGLYITKGIVEKHGGTVFAQSEGLSRGSTFVLTLPANVALNGSGADDEDDESVTPGSYCEDASLGSDGDQAPRSILVVDDVLANRRLLARLLQKNGDVCEMAEDGVDCLDRVSAANEEGRHFDIIILDYEMPRMNGPSCAKSLRDSGCSSLIVGLTGNCMLEDIRRFESHGADAVLPKPFKLDALQDIWRRRGIGK